MAPTEETEAPTSDPAQFSAERFEAHVRTLVAFGARPLGSEALTSAREWAEAIVPETQADASVVLVAPLATREVTGDALAEESSGAAFVIEVARALRARRVPVHVAFAAGEIAPVAPVAGAGVAVWVRRACGLPQQRDLLSHRVLRERFFRAAGVSKLDFAQVDAPHDALLAAGAERVVALDGPAAGATCEPGAFGDALARFVSDATALLARGRSNFGPPHSSQAP
jgi:hypothetical protein